MSRRRVKTGALASDSRWTDKESKQLHQLEFPGHFKKSVDLSRVQMQVIRPWITARVTELLGIDDDVVCDYAFSLLEDADNTSPDPRKLQVALMGFLNQHAAQFVSELWTLLLSAQDSIGGIPQEFVEKKKRELAAQRAAQGGSGGPGRGGEDGGPESGGPGPSRGDNQRGGPSRFDGQRGGRGNETMATAEEEGGWEGQIAGTTDIPDGGQRMNETSTTADGTKAVAAAGEGKTSTATLMVADEAVVVPDQSLAHPHHEEGRKGAILPLRNPEIASMNRATEPADAPLPTLAPGLPLPAQQGHETTETVATGMMAQIGPMTREKIDLDHAEGALRLTRRARQEGRSRPSRAHARLPTADDAGRHPRALVHPPPRLIFVIGVRILGRQLRGRVPACSRKQTQKNARECSESDL
ncbi:hypothetical protein OC845_004943 [Tilletia horrida]|nr:hypothetical protein OC845_004943 [Tilletia horrida]